MYIQYLYVYVYVMYSTVYGKTKLSTNEMVNGTTCACTRLIMIGFTLYMYVHFLHVHTVSQIEALKIHTLYFNDPFHQVYSFGNGSGVGKGTTEPRQYTPWLIEPLDGEMIIDVCTGDGHCLALTQSKSLHSFYCVCSLDYSHFESC